MKKVACNTITFGVALLVIALFFSGCGGQGSTTDGQWLAHGQQGVYFLDISSNQGTVDYADYVQGQGLNRYHADITVNNDGTVSISGLYNGELRDCASCTYQLSGGNLVINYTYNSYGSQGSGKLTFSSSDSSTYQNEVNKLQP